MNVLVVDDDKTIRNLVAEMIEIKFSRNVETFADGLSARQAIENEFNNFDLVITDCEMPGIDGLELTERIKKCYPDIRVIVISGRHNKESAALEAGADSFLKKPFSFDDLAETIRRVL